MKYCICIKHKDNTISYLQHKGRSEWCYRIARKHLKDVIGELSHGDSKWRNVRYFALVAA